MFSWAQKELAKSFSRYIAIKDMPKFHEDHFSNKLSSFQKIKSAHQIVNTSESSSDSDDTVSRLNCFYLPVLIFVKQMGLRVKEQIDIIANANANVLERYYF